MLEGGRQIFISFQGVESAFYLWINGQQVGYSEDSYTPADFNITPYLHEGETPSPSRYTAGRTAVTWRTRTSSV